MLAAALLLPSLITAGTAPPPDAIKLPEPRVEYRDNEASATRSPWVDANGWRILRNPGKTFIYEVKGEAAALAAAESFMYGTGALIAADAPGLGAFEKMLAFLKTIPAADLSPVADFGVIDDGSNTTGELLNLLSRMNLLYKAEKTPDRNFRVNVRLGTREYPPEDSQNPSLTAHKVRSQLGDDNRSVRVYGSEVVVARYLKGPGQARIFLLNYSAHPILGLQVRVRGGYAGGQLRACGLTDAHLAELSQDGPATEFTVPELHDFAVIDLIEK